MSELNKWTIKAALDWTEGYLERKGDENPRLSAQWLLAEACGLRRIDLYVRYDQPLTLDEREKLRTYVARRGKGEPLQYITGEVGFRHITVKVQPGVLIPRPETEVLVSEVLNLLPLASRPRAREDEPKKDFSPHNDELPSDPALHQPPTYSAIDRHKPALLCEDVTGREFFANSEQDKVTQCATANKLLVADLCTGSGCIACSLAYEHPLIQVIATDIDPQAVALARANSETLKIDDRVSVIHCDLGEGIPSEFLGAFDIVVSNPPYIPTSLLGSLPREVGGFEPHLALDGGLDGLTLFRRLLPFCSVALKPGGFFAFELQETTLDEAAHLATQQGFVRLRIVPDLTGRPRVLTGAIPSSQVGS